MIKYALRCRNGHAFDTWFANAASFDRQVTQGEVTCPSCHSAEVDKAIMTPALANGARPAPGAESQQTQSSGLLHDAEDRCLRADIQAFRQRVVELTEDVGRDFAAEVRKIVDGDAQDRPIRGEATLQEARALLDDGVCIVPVPPSPKDFN